MREKFKQAMEALERGRRFLTHDVWRIGRPGEEVPHGLIIKQARVAILLFQNLTSDMLWLRAAALSFATILSIVPLLALMFFIINALNLGENLSDVVEFRVRSYAERVGVTPEAAVPTEETATKSRELIELSLEWLLQGVPGASDDSPDRQNPLTMILQWVENSSQPTAIGTVLGLAFVITTVFGLMNNIESSFNAIWGLKRTRSWYRMASDYMMIILVLPFLVATVFGVTGALESERFELGPFGVGLSGIRYAVMWAAFATMYYIVPNTRVRARYALLGGMVAGTLWLLTARIYVGSQAGLASRDLFYGGFALVPLSMAWIYVSWLIVLFGAELTFAYQYEKTFAMERLAAGASYAYREAVGLRAMLEIGRRFDEGLDPLNPNRCAEQWNVPVRLLNNALDHLEEAGLIGRGAARPVTFHPARSLDRITVGEVVGALREAGSEPSQFRTDESFAPLLTQIQCGDGAVRNMTIAEWVRRLRETPPSAEEPAAPEQDPAP